MGHLRACAREALAAVLYYFVAIYYHAAPWARFAHYSLTLMCPLTREWYLTAAPLCVWWKLREWRDTPGSGQRRGLDRPQLGTWPPIPRRSSTATAPRP